MLMADSDESLPRGVNVIDQQPITFAFGEIDREKPCRTWDVDTPGICHARC